MDGFIDTHAHIYLEDFDSEINAIISRSKAAGVEKILMPNIDGSSIDRIDKLADQYPDYCYPMMGLHPCSVTENYEEELIKVEKVLKEKKYYAVGEIGTDLYWEKKFWQQQKEAFVFQLGLGKELNLPVVIHCRESLDQTIDIVEANKDKRLHGVFHCFSGTVQQARRIMELEFYLGIGGVATFKNGGLDKVLPEIGISHIVLETDSPYLAPVPHRGKRNEPAYLPIIAERISNICDVTLHDVRRITSENARGLFNL